MGTKLDKVRNVIIVCTDRDCRTAGAKSIFKKCQRHLKDSKRRKTTMLVESKCIGICERGPIVGVQPANKWLTKAEPSSAIALINETLPGGKS